MQKQLRKCPETIPSTDDADADDDDRQADGRTDTVNPIYPLPTTLGGGITMTVIHVIMDTSQKLRPDVSVCA